MICAGLCVVGGVLALWVRNDVLAPVPAPVPAEAPAPGECLYCGVTDPPTHVSGRATTPVR